MFIGRRPGTTGQHQTVVPKRLHQTDARFGETRRSVTTVLLARLGVDTLEKTKRPNRAAPKTVTEKEARLARQSFIRFRVKQDKQELRKKNKRRRKFNAAPYTTLVPFLTCMYMYEHAETKCRPLLLKKQSPSKTKLSTALWAGPVIALVGMESTALDNGDQPLNN